MKRLALMILIAGLLVAACAAPASGPVTEQQDAGVTVTVYESPT